MQLISITLLRNFVQRQHEREIETEREKGKKEGWWNINQKKINISIKPGTQDTVHTHSAYEQIKKSGHGKSALISISQIKFICFVSSL